jgi:hypothetical protein
LEPPLGGSIRGNHCPGLIWDGNLGSDPRQGVEIGLKTVNEYCARLKQKMKVANIRQLVRIAVLWRAGVAEIVVRSVRGE